MMNTELITIKSLLMLDDNSAEITYTQSGDPLMHTVRGGLCTVGEKTDGEYPAVAVYFELYGETK
jgi:hypothetical protein